MGPIGCPLQFIQAHLALLHLGIPGVINHILRLAVRAKNDGMVAGPTDMARDTMQNAWAVASLTVRTREHSRGQEQMAVAIKMEATVSFALVGSHECLLRGEKSRVVDRLVEIIPEIHNPPSAGECLRDAQRGIPDTNVPFLHLGRVSGLRGLATPNPCLAPHTEHGSPNDGQTEARYLHNSTVLKPPRHAEETGSSLPLRE